MRFNTVMAGLAFLSAGLILPLGTYSLAAPDAPSGFASVSGNGLSTTTGGQGGETVTVTTWTDFKNYAESVTPYIILVQGTIPAPTNGASIKVKSNKTIVGLGSDATLYQGELTLLTVSNVIIRNLTIRDSYVEGDYDGKTNDFDAIQADSSHHIWIDHCHFSHCGDGLIDLRLVCDNVTISWTILSNHNKAFGIGWTDQTEFRTTIHHCWFDQTNQRNPSFDMGIGHMYNNYMSGITSYGNYARGMARLVIENSVFENSNNPVQYDSTAVCYISGLQFINCTGTQSGNSTTMPFNPLDSYSYTLDATSQVKSIVTAQSGPKAYIGTQYTGDDLTPPTPNPMTWAQVPYSTGGVDIAMAATTASDTSGVQYYFANLTDASHDSGWIDSPLWTDTGLQVATTYSYAVKARDTSAWANETDWSTPAVSATTAAWLCSDAIAGDLNGDCRVHMDDFGILAAQWMSNPSAGELVYNGGFDAGLSSWTTVALSGATGTMTASSDAAIGNPPASALIQTDTGSTGANNHRFYQVIPVTVGKEYVFNGDWSGDISGTVATNSSARNWAEVFIGFTNNAVPGDSDFGSIIYKKAYGNGNLNTTNGIWDWEPITASPNGSGAPAGGIFVATAPYMCISFNLGGRADSGSTHIRVDNVTVTENLPCSEIDLNDDCLLDLQDLIVFAQDWLSCNRQPSSECGQ